MPAIRVLIAEDNAVMRRALADVVADDPELEVVGLAADTQEAIERARELRPDVALVDVRMPGGGGPVASREMRTLGRPPRVVAMSASRERQAIVGMLRAGAVGYLVKGGPVGEVHNAIKGAYRGEASLSSPAAERLIDTVLEQLDSDEADAAERRALERRLRAVIAGDGLSSVFQPIYELGSGVIAGCEALARFSAEPARGPLAWFAEATEFGLGLEFELAAIRSALDAATASGGLDRITDGFLAVNASPATLTDAAFSSILDGPLDPSRIVVEVTEHARIEDYRAFQRALAGCRDRGVRLAVDDVGSGYASLQHILRLAPDFIKLDISLIRRIERDRPKRAMAAAMISFAAETACTVVAEGIETLHQLDELVALGAHYGQGYFLARPAPLESLAVQAGGS